MTQTVQRHFGGSFAPPLTDELLASYEKLASSAPPRVRDAVATLLSCCKAWWGLPASKGSQVWQHASGVGVVVPLEKQHQEALFDHIPWSSRSNGKGTPDELEAIASVLESITDKPLRDAAHHLLWHVVELDLDREPLTSDQLKGSP